MEVVSYRNSTSNHNDMSYMRDFELVVSYRNSTSNHNAVVVHLTCQELYLIEILHQTTTFFGENMFDLSCILSKFYIKPQLVAIPLLLNMSCILSKFYIKPQLSFLKYRPEPRCILSKFYIKPQLYRRRDMLPRVVSYRNSTSNHNNGG